MKTKNRTGVFKNFGHFLERLDKTVNGVSPEFAKRNPNYANDNQSNTGCWNCANCIGCVDCFFCESCNNCKLCIACKNSCRSLNCFFCETCSDCENIESGSDLYKGKNDFQIPKIENIHQRVWAAVQVEGALNMNSWHKDGFCGTTHCRAGHVVALAKEEGRALECQTSTAFAAAQIYKASSKIEVPTYQFYVDEVKAKADIEQCAKMEETNKNN